MKSFPFDMMLNTRVGPEDLARKVANVFGFKYGPSNLNTIDIQDKDKTVREGKKVENEFKLHAIIDPAIPKALAQRVEFVLKSKQTNEKENYIVKFEDIILSKSNQDDKKCIEKLELVEETEYGESVECDHSYDRRCHTTYATKYVSQQREECDDDYKRECVIKFDKVALNETVTICKRPLVKDCNAKLPEICRTEYESVCWTVNEHNQVI